ncbi:MAG: modification methylase [Ruminococcaceae bacterium]|nr:modification methylase [Oscillospiraceae bacterium]
MAGNKNLGNAKMGRNDEFYTQLADIEMELKHYRKHFAGKTVFCNCDDPYESNFFKYFAMNFNYLGLKKLIATCYSGSPIVGEEFEQLSLFDIIPNEKNSPKKYPYKIEITEVSDANGDGVIDLTDIEYLLQNNQNTLSLLEGNGDFRSDECISLLKESDIVVTNPPFSLFKEFLPLLIKYKKNFIIIASMQSIKYKEIFPLILKNEVWAGYSFNKTMEFVMPPEYQLKGKAFIDEKGRKHGYVPGICWLTNLDIKKRHEFFEMYKKYDPEIYKKYDNYDAIEVKNINDIPYDYDGNMGVPISFLDKLNPEQFELIGSSDVSDTLEGIKVLGEEWIRKYREQGGTGHYTANMKSVGYSGDGKHKIIFSRLIIRHKKNNKI